MRKKKVPTFNPGVNTLLSGLNAWDNKRNETLKRIREEKRRNKQHGKNNRN